MPDSTLGPLLGLGLGRTLAVQYPGVHAAPLLKVLQPAHCTGDGAQNPPTSSFLRFNSPWGGLLSLQHSERRLPSSQPRLHDLVLEVEVLLTVSWDKATVHSALGYRVTGQHNGPPHWNSACPGPVPG